MAGERRPRIPELEGALAAFRESQQRSAELLTSATSFSPSLASLAVQLPVADFRRSLTIDLPKVVPSATLGADIVRGLQVLDVSRILQEEFRRPAINLAASVQQTMELYAGIAEQLQRPAQLVQDWVNQHQRMIRSLTASIVAFHQEQQRRAANARAFAERHGWPLPLLLLEHGQFIEIAEMVDFPKREVSRAMQQAFRPRTQARRDALAAILSSPHFASRRPIVMQAVRAMARSEWYLVINALLPMLEGVLVDVAFPVGERPQWKALERSLKVVRDDDTDRALVAAAFASLETLLIGAGAGSAIFSRSDPNAYGVPGEPRALNRHAILHGAARRYGTADNALKLFLLLVVMIEALPPPSA